MQPWPDIETWREIGTTARKAAAHLRLPFHRQTWRGNVGNWMGAGTGSSIDFQDHRPYLPGDDPRYIDWQAYARTGHYIMKLYREEVSPRLDLVFDASSSMFFVPEKQTRSLELFSFCVESAARAGASLRVFLARGGDIRHVPDEAVRACAFPDFENGDFQALENSVLKTSKDGKNVTRASLPVPSVAKIPFRPGSMRVCISDLLFPGEPDALLQPLVAARGRGVLLAPFDADEAEPAWDGNFDFIECESGAQRIQRVDAALRANYGTAYRRHFEIWRDGCRRLGILFARVPSADDLVTALRAHALPQGAAEVT